MSRPLGYGQRKLAEAHGQPAPGMAWCGGIGRAPHQVPEDDLKPGKCKCRGCITRQNREYQRTHPRVDRRKSYGRHDKVIIESYDRPVDPMRKPPGNDGTVRLPSWGYGGFSINRQRNRDMRGTA